MQPTRCHLQNTLVAALLLGSMVLGWTGCQSASQPRYTREQLIQMAEADLKAGRFHKAISELNLALTQDPHNTQVLLDLGWVYVYTDQLADASEQVTRVTAIDPKNPGLPYLKGAVLAKMGQYVDALESYNEALRYDVNNPQLHGDIAHAFLAINELEAALKEYTVAHKLDPNNNDYDFGACMVYRQLKKYPQALSRCQHALDNADDDQEADRIQTVLESVRLVQQLEAPAPPYD